MNTLLFAFVLFSVALQVQAGKPSKEQIEQKSGAVVPQAARGKPSKEQIEQKSGAVVPEAARGKPSKEQIEQKSGAAHELTHAVQQSGAISK